MDKQLEGRSSLFSQELRAALEEVESLLIAKNVAYGDSALSPVRIFSKASPVEQIRVRIDDKLSRLKTGLPDNEDAEMDMLGYLVLLRIARRRDHFGVPANASAKSIY